MNFIEFIHNNPGEVFEMIYVTRGRGETRHIVCRSEGSAKGGIGYDRASKGLITVYSLTDGGYRPVPIDSIISITYKDKTVGMMAADEEEFFGEDIAEV